MNENLIAVAAIVGTIVVGLLLLGLQARREIRLERQIDELREQRALLRLNQEYAELLDRENDRG